MKYFLIAGELSGDLHGAQLVRKIQSEDPEAEFEYWGGNHMQNALRKPPLKHIMDLSFMGFVEVAANILTIVKNFKLVKEQILNTSSEVVVFIDFPGFNLRLASWVKQHNIQTWYYISPTVWAWKSNRKEIVRKYIDRMMVIFPFEVEWYKNHGIQVEYVGNPTYEALKNHQPSPLFLEQNNVQKPFIALFPGSRIQEIKNILPIMLGTARHFLESYQIVIAKAENLDHELYSEIIKPYTFQAKIIEKANYDIMSYASAALITSGTATLEAAILGLPHVICYKTSWLNYGIAKLFVRLKFIGLPNIILGKSIVPECIQSECTVDQLKVSLQSMTDIDEIERGSIFRELRRELEVG